jgi:hypothetical protein
MIRICHVSRAEMESEVHRLASSTKTQILARMHEYREMDPVRITDGIAVTDRQRSVAMAFLTWCRRSGKSFGPANIDAVFTEFQADKAG